MHKGGMRTNQTRNRYRAGLLGGSSMPEKEPRPLLLT